MSRSGRSGISQVAGTHWKNPLFIAEDGPLDDVPHGPVDGCLSPYKIYVEDFGSQMADAQLAKSGWIVTDTGTPTTPTEVVLTAGIMQQTLHLNPGTKEDSGIECQFAAAGATDAVISLHNVLPNFTQIAETMDAQEIFFQVRVGHVNADAADNDNKWLIGFFETDTTVLSETTALPLVPAGGGFGFHKGETGAVTCLSTEAAITAAGTACVPAVNHLALTTNAVAEWHTYAARCRVTDGSAGTGRTDFWVDGRHRLSLATVPFDATDEHAFTIAIHNGPATVNVSDMFVDYIITGRTRPGLVYPYTSGVIY